ncbi:MAG TPA: hypothetical protein VGL00_07030 [Terracidiphilus sp.]|jgi:hypothetical protein
MLGFTRRKSADENPGSSLHLVIGWLVAMSILFGFGLATLIFRLQTHTRPDAIIPALLLSLAGLCVQFGMARFLIRHITQTQE